jgi:hypothetical protein
MYIKIPTHLLAIPILYLVASGTHGADIEFNRDIRPILAEHCLACHGPDLNRREAGLRLDLREQATRPAESGLTAIAPHAPDRSELVKRILTEDPDQRMPPPDSDKPLSEAQKKLLQAWIQQGAPYQGHWAFQVPQRPDLPMLDASDAHDLHPIDRFILARLKSEGMTLSPPADRVTLLRRATLDLIGLPPTPQEVEDFLKDHSPNAFERVIDRLLASPHYGERMALTWMDYARYADSNGFQSDGSRDIWAWRDWLISAYNRNLPFDQFTIEQLAGDLLPDATRDQIIATGFNRNHRLNGEGGRIEAEWFVETVIDRVETTGLTWLGLTLNCCRCHDHKYDPISQREFYSFFAFFNSIDEKGVLAPVGKNGENTPPLLTLSSDQDRHEIDRLEALVSKAEADLQTAKDNLPASISAWEKSIAGRPDQPPGHWRELFEPTVNSKGGAKFTRLDDGSYLAGGDNPENDTYLIRGLLSGTELTAIRLEVFPDPSLPDASLGRGSNGNFVLTDVVAEVDAPGQPNSLRLRFNKAMADYEQPGWTAQSILTPRKKRSESSNVGWAINGNDPSKRLPRILVLQLNRPIALTEGARLQVQLLHASRFKDHQVGRFRLSFTSLPPERISVGQDNAYREVEQVLKIPPESRTDPQTKQLAEFFKKNVESDYSLARKNLDGALKKLQEFRETLPTTMVMKEGAPREAFVLTRGQYDQPGEKVARGVPAIFSPIPAGEPMNRLGLARWIAHRDNPLTARVWVNREWERFFGTGLVKTSENLGTQSEYPSHPELLDWLACEFMQPSLPEYASGRATSPWDMKALQKRILMSRTYQQSSRVDRSTFHRDPENRLLSRGSRIRLHGEVLRDCALATSGLLVKTIGGPSVRPYMPEGVWDETSKYGNLRNYKHDQGDGLYRRTMYTIWKRTAAPPSLLLFDAPNREACVVKRSRTNTPLQALSLLNEVTFVEAARHLAARMVKEGGPSNPERIRFGFQCAVGRIPSDAEIELLHRGLRADQERFRTQIEAAHQLLRTGASTSPSDLDVPTHAAYTLLANVLLNLDEFVSRE